MFCAHVFFNTREKPSNNKNSFFQCSPILVFKKTTTTIKIRKAYFVLCPCSFQKERQTRITTKEKQSFPMFCTILVFKKQENDKSKRDPVRVIAVKSNDYLDQLKRARVRIRAYESGNGRRGQPNNGFYGFTLQSNHRK